MWVSFWSQTVDALFVSKFVANSCKEKHYKFYVDLTKAYDKVDRDLNWLVLERIGFPPKIVQLIKAFHVGAKARVRINGTFSDEFGLDKGLKQGSVFAPLLFNVFFGAIVMEIRRRLRDRFGIKLAFRLDGSMFDVSRLKRLTKLKYVNIAELLFADDAELLAHSAEDLQRMIDVFVEVTDAFGQEVSIKKTEVMVVQGEPGVLAAPDIKIKGVSLKVVETFKYVGGTEKACALRSVCVYSGWLQHSVKCQQRCSETKLLS